MIATLAFTTAMAPGHRAASQQLPTTSSDEVTYWCPMHPNIRGKAGDTCALCRMALVPAAPAGYQAYVLDFDTGPRVLRARQKARVHFHVREPHMHAVVRRFELVHERVFHLFIVSHDLEYFAHVHPTLRSSGTLDAEVELPRPGAYQMIADFLPTGGAPQLIQKSFATAGYRGGLAAIPHLVPDAADKIIHGTRVKLTMPEAVAGREQLITFDMQDEVSGTPVRDLQPYLGATGHMLLASSDLAIAAHSHPVAEISALGGPTVVFQVLFPRGGDYRLWAQFQRHGEVLTASFNVPVKGRY